MVSTHQHVLCFLFYSFFSPLIYPLPTWLSTLLLGISYTSWSFSLNYQGYLHINFPFFFFPYFALFSFFFLTGWKKIKWKKEKYD
ncbi:hypothetical protein DFH27DRAFT_543931, partial [Peziza echinospora]